MSPPKSRAPTGQWPETARTRDGVAYHIRPIRPDDLDREREFILGLSVRTRFQRFQHTLGEPSEDFIARLVRVDYHREMALLASQGEGAAEHILAVARYAADDDGDDCEFAVVVADEWQGRGIGTTLARRLFAYAADEGFASIYGTVLVDNAAMIGLARSLGLEVESAARGQDMVRASRRLTSPRGSRSR